MAKKMTQAQFTTNTRKSVINNEYEPGKTIPNDTILTVTDLEKKFRFTGAVSNRGKIDDGRKLMTSTPMILENAKGAVTGRSQCEKALVQQKTQSDEISSGSQHRQYHKLLTICKRRRSQHRYFRRRAAGQQRTTLSKQTRSATRTSSVTQDAKEIIQFEHVDHENL